MNAIEVCKKDIIYNKSVQKDQKPGKEKEIKVKASCVLGQVSAEPLKHNRKKENGRILIKSKSGIPNDTKEQIGKVPSSNMVSTQKLNVFFNQ